MIVLTGVYRVLVFPRLQPSDADLHNTVRRSSYLTENTD